MSSLNIAKYLVNILHVKNTSSTGNTILQFFSITVYGHVFLYILGFFHCSFNSKNERNLNISTELLSLKRTRLLSLVENEHKKQTTSTAAQKKFDKFLHVEMKLSELSCLSDTFRSRQGFDSMYRTGFHYKWEEFVNTLIKSREFSPRSPVSSHNES